MESSIRGIPETKNMIAAEMGTRRAAILKAAERVSEDLLRRARDNSPLQTGWLVDSGSARVNDMGAGDGFRIEVGFDTPYAVRMHEAHYQARPKLTAKERRVRDRDSGGVVDISDLFADLGGNFYGKRGRKYLSRAWADNREKYEAALAAAGV